MKVLFVFSLLLSLISVAQADEAPDAMQFSQSVAKFTKWGDLDAAMNTEMAPVLGMRLAAVTKDLPFPTIQLQKHTLVITDPAGGKKVYVTLGANGEATLNGVSVVLNPLEPVKGELERFQSLRATRAPAHASLWDLLVPNAEAKAKKADDSKPSSADAAAYGVIASWTAKNCGYALPYPKHPGMCMVWGKLSPDEAKPFVIPPAERYISIGFKCAADNKGTTEILAKNHIGDFIRKRLTYQNGVPTHYILEGDTPGQPWHTVVEFDPREKISDPNIAALFKWKTDDVDGFTNKVCDGGPDAKALFEAVTAQHRQILAKPLPVSDDSSSGGPSSGDADAK